MARLSQFYSGLCTRACDRLGLLTWKTMTTASCKTNETMSGDDNTRPTGLARAKVLQGRV